MCRQIWFFRSSIFHTLQNKKSSWWCALLTTYGINVVPNVSWSLKSLWVILCCFFLIPTILFAAWLEIFQGASDWKQLFVKQCSFPLQTIKSVEHELCFRFCTYVSATITFTVKIRSVEFSLIFDIMVDTVMIIISSQLIHCTLIFKIFTSTWNIVENTFYSVFFKYIIYNFILMYWLKLLLTFIIVKRKLIYGIILR